MKRGFSFTCHLFLWLAMALTNPAKAQLTVVKDNIACAYGLKNSQGQWVVPAAYTLLENLPNGCFRSTGPKGIGVLNTNGEVMVPGTYSQVSLAQYGLYLVYNQKMVGVLNNRGIQLFPPQYNVFLPDQRGRFLLYHQHNNAYSSMYADTTGAIIIPETPGFIRPFENRTLTPIGDIGDAEEGVMGNAGVIDVNGRLVIPRQYDGLRHCGGRWIVLKTWLTGILEMDGRVVMEPRYTVKMPPYYGSSSQMPCLYGDHMWMITDKGKLGLLKGDGTVMAQPIYDEINPIISDWQTPLSSYIFRQGNKLGVMARNGHITAPAVYDTIETRSWREPNTYDIPKTVHFFKQNGRFGLMNDAGQIVVAATHDAYFREDFASKPYYLFTSDLNVWVVDLSAKNISAMPAGSVYHGDTIHIYRFNNDVFPLFSTRKPPRKLVTSGAGALNYQQAGVLIPVKLPDRTLFFTREGIPWGRDNIKYIDLQSGNYGQLYCNNNKTGLVNLNTGRLVLDTIYQSINQSFAGRNIIWAQLHPLVHKVNGDRWVVLDTNGRAKSSVLFDRPNSGENLITYSSGGFIGVVDADFNPLIPPAYKWVERIAKNYFAVQSKGGRYGIIDAQNKWVTDTLYTKYQSIYSNYAKYYISTANNLQAWWLLKSPQQDILVNNNGRIIKASDPRFNLLLDSLALKGRTNMAEGAFKILLTPLQEDSLQMAPYMQQLIRLTRVHSDSCSHCAYKLTWVAPSSCTVEINYSETPPRPRFGIPEPQMSYLVRKFNNYYWANGQLTGIHLADIFGNGPLLQNQLVDAIKARDDLNLDCSNPATLTQQAQGRFSLSGKGVTLYLSNKTQYHDLIELLVPVAELEKHPESKWLVPYLQSAH